MKFKKPFSIKKEPYPTDAKPRVKNSYYTFSKEYPASMIVKTKRVRRKKERIRSALRIAFAVVCFILISAIAYFFVSVGLEISNKPADEAGALSSVSKDEFENLLETDVLRALYMPERILGNQKELSSFIRKIKRKDCNSVIIDFKNKSGRTLYSSQNETAVLGKCAIFDNETVRDAIQEFENNNINVIARFFCFEDETASSTEPEFAVKYKDTDVLWLDELSEGKGKTWLNPYSKGAVSYLLGLINETVSFGVKGFILEAVSFPKAEDISTAGFPGEKSFGERNKTLLRFIEKVKAAVPKGCFVLAAETCTDAFNGNETLYSGSLNKSFADGLCVDTTVRPEEYVIDKKSHYSSLITLLTGIAGKQSSGSSLVPVISIDDYTRRYVRTLESAGFDSYILFDESGNY